MGKTNRKERRKGPDILQRLIVLVSLLAWVIFISALVVYHYARPEIAYSAFQSSGTEVYRDHWVEDLRQVFLLLLWTCCGITLGGMLINWSRSRRRTDYFKMNTGLLAAIVIAILLFYYLP